MLLAQAAGQLNNQMKDDFWKTLFPSGNVTERSVSMQTISELNIKSVDDSKKQTEKEGTQPNQPNQLPQPNQGKQTSRRERRHNESVRARLDKRQEKQEEKYKTKQKEEKAKLEQIKNKVKAETKEVDKTEAVKTEAVIPDRIKRIIGI